VGVETCGGVETRGSGDSWGRRLVGVETRGGGDSWGRRLVETRGGGGSWVGAVSSEALAVAVPRCSCSPVGEKMGRQERGREGGIEGWRAGGRS